MLDIRCLQIELLETQGYRTLDFIGSHPLIKSRDGDNGDIDVREYIDHHVLE